MNVRRIIPELIKLRKKVEGLSIDKELTIMSHICREIETYLGLVINYYFYF